MIVTEEAKRFIAREWRDSSGNKSIDTPFATAVSLSADEFDKVVATS